MAFQLSAYPPKNATDRLQRYRHFRRLFVGDHKTAFRIQPRPFQALRYLTANFAGMISRLSADLLFGQEPSFQSPAEGTKGDATQGAIDDIVRRNELHILNYESSLGASYRGDGVLKLRWGPRNADDPEAKPEAIIESVPAAIYFPEVSQDNRRQVRAVTLAWPKEKPLPAGAIGNPEQYLRVEHHTPGKIENSLWRIEGEKRTQRQVPLNTFPEYEKLPDEEETRLPHIPIFHVPNYRDDDEYWGISDYEGLESIFEAVNNRHTQIDDVLDKHVMPRLTVPEKLVDENQCVALSDLEAIPLGPGDLVPTYITWNAQLEAAYRQIEVLQETLFILTETSPAAFGIDRYGVAESGRALRLRLLRTVAKIRRKQLYYERGLRAALHTALLFQALWGNDKGLEPEEPLMAWADPLPPDLVEMIQNEATRLAGAPTSSVQSAIARLDGADSVEAEVERMEEEGVLAAVTTGAAGARGQEAAPAMPAPPEPEAQGGE